MVDHTTLKETDIELSKTADTWTQPAVAHQPPLKLDGGYRAWSCLVGGYVLLPSSTRPPILTKPPVSLSPPSLLAM